MDSRIKVLIVDDSVVVRRMLVSILESEPQIEIVGWAASGLSALQKLTLLDPDLVLLDVMMPDMDGIKTVRRMRLTHPTMPVIMCSSLTESGADTTLRALAAGATDHVAKPGPGENQLEVFRAELLEKVLALGCATQAPRQEDSVEVDVTLAPPPPVPMRPAVIQALAIGSSTGGPNALAELFAKLPGDLPVPILIVQHMPTLFTKILADRLTACSRVRVAEATHGMPLEPGRGYMAPGDFHLKVGRANGQLIALTTQEAPEQSCRPAVDVLFRSLARIFRDGVLACVLTGMGRDGASGAADLVRAGSKVLAQSAETCVIPSMPGAIVEARLADKVLHLDRMADEIVARIRRSHGAPERLRAQGER
ncbi:MAG TPA: chemotaxis-specific protein-glutamate methyltransferase CheB [Polyangiaceae bacterium]|nr:chemotaxis-specific protein-glutamate methyltransferase CheB [Polyangiaceae bacterium]